jgi:hypothetical protein
MEMPESVKMSCSVLNEDKPLTLEQTILKHFKFSANTKAKLFTDDIIQKIASCGFDTQFHPRDVATILLKCGIGTKSSNGGVSIDKVQKKGYSNIIYIPPKENDEDSDSEED